MTNKEDYLSLAEAIAREAHKGQHRWGGDPYHTHPERIANQLSTIPEKATAWLHDVVEDTDITLKDLESLGIPGTVVGAVKAITKRDGEEYLDYILRVTVNPLATRIKIKDLEDNMTDATKQRKDKYILARYILEKVL